MTRRRFTEREVLETLLLQRVSILCYRCKLPMMTLSGIEREHLHEIALDGRDEPSNCRYSHLLCHKEITNGTPATTAGSSKHKIAKDRHIRAGKMAVKKGKKPKRTAWAKRVGAWPKGRKMQSKGFVKI